jgi:hypothetical protein
VDFCDFNPRELAKLRGYISCFIVAAVACLLVLDSIKQFENRRFSGAKSHDVILGLTFNNFD